MNLARISCPSSQLQLSLNGVGLAVFGNVVLPNKSTNLGVVGFGHSFQANEVMRDASMAIDQLKHRRNQALA